MVGKNLITYNPSHHSQPYIFNGSHSKSWRLCFVADIIFRVMVFDYRWEDRVGVVDKLWGWTQFLSFRSRDLVKAEKGEKWRRARSGGRKKGELCRWPRAHPWEVQVQSPCQWIRPFSFFPGNSDRLTKCSCVNWKLCFGKLEEGNKGQPRQGLQTQADTLINQNLIFLIFT